MQAQTLIEQSLINTLHRLPPEKVSEVADFAEFLAQRQDAQRHTQEDDRQLTQAAARLSSGAFAKVWDNPEDAVYDTL